MPMVEIGFAALIPVGMTMMSLPIGTRGQTIGPVVGILGIGAGVKPSIDILLG